MANPRSKTSNDEDRSRERRCVVSGEVLPEHRLIRFVAGPDGAVVPDLARKLPGRGLWTEASRPAVETAARKGLFSRAAKAKLTAAPDLADLVEKLLTRRCLDQLGLARREGVLISGFEKSLSALKSGKAGWLIEAVDGSADGRDRLLAVLPHLASPPPVCGLFSAEDLGLALGLENVIHVVLLAGRRAERWTEEVRKLAGFRPLLPESWGEGARNGRGESPSPNLFLGDQRSGADGSETSKASG
ncbi:MAG TPA: RNA-binding protein [Caulobacteraceae bacterium]|nr:RNA-binding protein [Caulobacteraceae bacterium]